VSISPNTSYINQISNNPVRYLLIFLELRGQAVEQVVFLAVWV